MSAQNSRTAKKDSFLIRMIPVIVFLLLFLLMFFPELRKSRQKWNPPEIPELTSRVVDSAKVFGKTGADQIDAAILRLEKTTGGQMAILTIPSLNGQTMEEYSIRVAEKWKIGHKGKDDGAILVIAVKDRSLRLEIGYGWEGKINDARAGDIIRGMIPRMKTGDYTGAAVYAVTGVQEFITGQKIARKDQKAAKVRRRKENSGSDVLFFIIFFLVFGGFIFLPGFFRGGGGGFHGGGGSFGGGGFHGGGGGSFGGGGASGRW